MATPAQSVTASSALTAPSVPSVPVPSVPVASAPVLPVSEAQVPQSTIVGNSTSVGAFTTQTTVLADGETSTIVSPAETSTSQSSASSSGVSTGAIAGASVGCLIAGLAIGALIAFFFLRRKNNKNGRYSPASSDTGHIAVGPEPKAYASSAPAPVANRGGGGIQMSQFLLDATPDKEIASELQARGELIHQHVENHYHMRPVQVSPQSLAPGLSNLGIGELSRLGTEEIAALCIDPKTRQAGLQHVISLAVFGSVDFNARGRYSMLPAPISSFLQSVPPVESRGGDRDATSLALSQWRSLSVFLLHPNRSQRMPLAPNESEVAPKAQSLATALNTYLHHFVSADQGSQRQQLDHLQAVIFECARLGYEVLSQPGDWRFTYRTEGVAAGVVVCPGLDKASDKDGKTYSSPRRVVEAVTAQVPSRNR